MFWCVILHFFRLYHLSEISYNFFSLVELLDLYLSFLQKIQRSGSTAELGFSISRERILWDECCWGRGSESCLGWVLESFNRSFLCVKVARHERWYLTGNSGKPFSPKVTSKSFLCPLIYAAWRNVSQELTSRHSHKSESPAPHIMQHWIECSAIALLILWKLDFVKTFFWNSLYPSL
jgi:hypothetical protein